MQPNICVKIPERCFISPDPGRDFPFAFSFAITYGYVPDSCIENIESNGTLPGRDGLGAVKYPQVTISGFDKLLSEPQKIDAFVNNLKKTGDSDWIIHKASSGTDIVIRYTGLELSPDFYFSASTESLVADTKENDVVTMLVKVENFDHIENNCYGISTKVDYVPWAKSVTFGKSPVTLGTSVEVGYEYLGDKTDKKLMQNGVAVDTARSPYTAFIDRPALFSLMAFNDCGMIDSKEEFLDVLPPEILSFTADKSYFSDGDAVTLRWELTSVSNITIDNMDEKTDQAGEGKAVVYPAASGSGGFAEYVLRANGYKGGAPASVSRKVTLRHTMWKNAGSQKGYFSGEVYGNWKYNSRIFREGEFYYCYAHPCLYKSGDGLNWEKDSTNNRAAGQFLCIAADCHDHVVYVMGKEGAEGKRLYISTYDFGTSKWEYAPAYQSWCADIGAFAFSRTGRAYAQTLENGIAIYRCGDDGKWNRGGAVIAAPAKRTVIGGDYCFYKKTFYAVMLCSDGYVYVYDCEESMEDILLKKKVGKNDRFVSLVPTENSLYIVTASCLANVVDGRAADGFSPMGEEADKRMWLGSDGDGGFFGIYPDKNLWRWNREK